MRKFSKIYLKIVEHHSTKVKAYFRDIIEETAPSTNINKTTNTTCLVSFACEKCDPQPHKTPETNENLTNKHNDNVKNS